MFTKELFSNKTKQAFRLIGQSYNDSKNKIGVNDFNENNNRNEYETTEN